MFALALRGVAARKLRTGLTALAVLLGVALMAGTYVLTDTINHSFDQIFEQGSKGTDVAIVPKSAVDLQSGDNPAFDASLLTRVRQVPGVRTAAGSIFSTGVTIFDSKGKRVGSEQAPAFGSSAQPKPFDPYTYSKGRPPQTADEVAVDALTGRKEGYRVGDRIKVGGEQPAREYRVTGLAKFGNVSSFGGATVAIFTLAEAQRVTGKQGKFDQIQVAAAPGFSSQALKRAIQRVMPPTVAVRTGHENAEQQASDIQDDLSFLKTALLIFAGVALFVGAFTIFNTFSITVAQRTREFGMLRTLGASRRQVMASVVGEASVIALIGSGLGLVAGFGAASLLNAMFKAAGIDLPNTGNVVEGRTIVVSLVVGIAVTLVAAIVPAVRATRVTPMEALRESGQSGGERRGRLVTVLAVLLLTAGLALMLVGLFADSGTNATLAMLLGGGALIFLAVGLLSPRLVRPIASLVGRPLERLRGLTGRLARENTVRNPGRTAVTAAALMIGLALVTFVAVFAAGFKGSIDDAIGKAIQGDLLLQNEDNFSPIPVAAGEQARRVPGVAGVSSLWFDQAKVHNTGKTSFMAGFDPRTIRSVVKLDWKKGSDATLARMGPRSAVIDEHWGKNHDIGVGDDLDVLTPADKRVTYQVIGSIKDNANLYGDFIVTSQAMASDFHERRPAMTFIDLANGADAGAVRERLDALIAAQFPVVDVLNQKELKDKQANNINKLLGLLYALLALAVIVSLFGIVNTLTLSIYERTRELGLLRAIGMSRRQVRRVVRYESVITALIGAVVGSVLGVLLAALASRPLASEGFVLKLPVATLLVLLVLAALAGVLAAILPARRASQLEVLDALAYE
jgi:putative ABC transport system permease protein